MRLAHRPARLIVLAAALLSGLACSLFRSEPPIQSPTAVVTPAPVVTQPVIPDTRPADFTVTYDWREGSLPPPYHYQYTIDVAADGTVTLTYIPDYPKDGVPEWVETVALNAADMDALYAMLADDGLFSTNWQKQDDPPVGGSSQSLTATAGGTTIEVPSYVVDDQAAAADGLAFTMKALIPQAIWDNLDAQRNQYITEHSE